jgi:hypothetical protein
VDVVAISSDAASGTAPLTAGSQIRVGAMQLAGAPSSAARIFRSEEHLIVQLESGSLV